VSWFQSLTYYLPNKLVYFCAIRVWAEATSGVYGNTVVPTITAGEAIQRFARIHGIPGHGKDAHYNSNRREVDSGTTREQQRYYERTVADPDFNEMKSPK
jgi:hypothetical protein